MILADKLVNLRTASGLSQEELAEKMNVSRQSVSKWESGASIPSMDKIVELSKIYGVSTDFLLIEENEDMPEEVVPDFAGNPMREVSIEEARDYLSRIQKVAKRTAIGVGLCIASSAPLMFFLGFVDEMNSEAAENWAVGIGVALILILVAIAVVMFITGGSHIEKYKFLETDEFQLSYGVEGILDKEREEYRPTYTKYVAIGVAVIIVGIVPLIIAGTVDAPDYFLLPMVGVLLLAIAVGVTLIVLADIHMNAYKRLLQIEEYTVARKERNHALRGVYDIYWMVVTAAYLLVSFFTMRWEITWVIWPVAAILSGVIQYFYKKK